MSQPADWRRFLHITRVCSLNRQAIERYGGLDAPPEIGCVAGAVGNAWSAVLYSEGGQAKSEAVFAGYVLYYLIRAHCFLDGNKRVGWLCCGHVLLKLGYRLETSDEESIDFCLRIASGEIKSASSAVDWVNERIEEFRL